MEEGVDGDDVDDRPLPSREHRGDGGAGRADRREEVQLQRGFEIGVADAEECVEPQADPADVVEELVDLAVSFERLGHEPLGAAGLDQFDGDGGDAVDSDQRLGRQRPGDDVRAFAGEQARDREADPLLAPVTTATLPLSSRSI